MQNFKEHQLIIYQNGDKFEIGKVKRITNNGAFVYYSSGDTAAKTPFDLMHPLVNAYTIIETSLGGNERSVHDQSVVAWLEKQMKKYPKSAMEGAIQTLIDNWNAGER